MKNIFIILYSIIFIQNCFSATCLPAPGNHSNVTITNDCEYNDTYTLFGANNTNLTGNKIGQDPNSIKTNANGLLNDLDTYLRTTLSSDFSIFAKNDQINSSNYLFPTDSLPQVSTTLTTFLSSSGGFTNNLGVYKKEGTNITFSGGMTFSNFISQADLVKMTNTNVANNWYFYICSGYDCSTINGNAPYSGSSISNLHFTSSVQKTSASIYGNFITIGGNGVANGLTLKDSIFTNFDVVTNNTNHNSGGLIGLYSSASNANYVFDSLLIGNNKFTENYFVGGTLIGVGNNSQTRLNNTLKVSITNSIFTANLITLNLGSNSSFGGSLVGASTNNTKIDTITNSIFNGNYLLVSVTNAIYGGGLIGTGYLVSGGAGIGKIENILVTGNTIDGYSNLTMYGGGLIGISNNTTSNKLTYINNALISENTISLSALYGGGILGVQSYGTMDIQNNFITKNTIKTNGESFGGGIIGFINLNGNSVPNVNNNIIDSNTLSFAGIMRGGGIIGAVTNSSNTIIDNIKGNLIINNNLTFAMEVGGGGIIGVNTNTTHDSHITNIENNIISNNTITSNATINRNINGGLIIGIYCGNNPNCYIGDIKNNLISSNNITLTTYNSTQGLIGINDGYVISISSTEISDNTINGGELVGGIIGIRTINNANGGNIKTMDGLLIKNNTITAETIIGGIIGMSGSNSYYTTLQNSTIMNNTIAYTTNSGNLYGSIIAIYNTKENKTNTFSKNIIINNTTTSVAGFYGGALSINTSVDNNNNTNPHTFNISDSLFYNNKTTLNSNTYYYNSIDFHSGGNNSSYNPILNLSGINYILDPISIVLNNSKTLTLNISGTLYWGGKHSGAIADNIVKDATISIANDSQIYLQDGFSLYNGISSNAFTANANSLATLNLSSSSNSLLGIGLNVDYVHITEERNADGTPKVPTLYKSGNIMYANITLGGSNTLKFYLPSAITADSTMLLLNGTLTLGNAKIDIVARNLTLDLAIGSQIVLVDSTSAIVGSLANDTVSVTGGATKIYQAKISKINSNKTLIADFVIEHYCAIPEHQSEKRCICADNPDDPICVVIPLTPEEACLLSPTTNGCRCVLNPADPSCNTAAAQDYCDTVAGAIDPKCTCLLNSSAPECLCVMTPTDPKCTCILSPSNPVCAPVPPNAQEACNNDPTQDGCYCFLNSTVDACYCALNPTDAQCTCITSPDNPICHPDQVPIAPINVQDPAFVNPGLKSLSEGKTTALVLLTNTQQLINDTIKTQIKSKSNINGAGISSFANSNANVGKYNTGSHINQYGMSLLAGLSLDNPFMLNKVNVGAFIETGINQYDTHNSAYINHNYVENVKSEGSSNNVGYGLLFKKEFASKIYFDTSFRNGYVNNKYYAQKIGALEDVKYDSKSQYYGGHVRIGYIFDITKTNNLDLYSIFDTQRIKSDTVRFSTGEAVKFDAITSNRIGFGVIYNDNYEDNKWWYMEGRIENELKGEVKARVIDTTMSNPEISAPTLNGYTYNLNVGYYNFIDDNWYFESKIGAFVGIRNGVSGNLIMKYRFGEDDKENSKIVNPIEVKEIVTAIAKKTEPVKKEKETKYNIVEYDKLRKKYFGEDDKSVLESVKTEQKPIEPTNDNALTRQNELEKKDNNSNVKIDKMDTNPDGAKIDKAETRTNDAKIDCGIKKCILSITPQTDSDKVRKLLLSFGIKEKTITYNNRKFTIQSDSENQLIVEVLVKHLRDNGINISNYP